MKTLKAICMTAILAMALSVPANAGDVYTPGFTPPPPPPPPSNTAGPTATSTNLSDTSTESFVDLLWVLASIL
jgi:hypothetical protein